MFHTIRFFCFFVLTVMVMPALGETLDSWSADCSVYCTGPICGGKELLKGKMKTAKSSTVSLKDAFKGFHLSLNVGETASHWKTFPDMDSFSILFTQGTGADTKLLSENKVLFDAASVQAGGRISLRTDWYGGNPQGKGNLAGICTLTRK